MSAKPPIVVSERRRKMRKIEAIHRQGERAIAELGPAPDASLLRDRRVLLALLLLVAVVGTLLVSKTNKATAQQQNYPMMRALREIDVLAVALGRYKFHVGEWPTQAIGIKGLAGHPGVPKWNGPYVSRYSRDAWGTDYVYSPPEPGSTNWPTLFSCGPDKLPNTPDDIRPSTPDKFDPGTEWTNGWRSTSERYLQFNLQRPGGS